ncbi:hypothetical protein CEP51_004920 [Fusarium floridanum]|uniref:Uncharacterized protein n=1 Tax=Fusarium floridanum TaxID=1325733 RepID=A0A428RZ10_9HYPO|nr:hypothetical protein CEP51_004920 [Fusarium floridanum]
MAVQGGSYQRHQGQRNRGRIFIIAVVLAFLFFNFGYRDITHTRYPPQLLSTSNKVSRLHYLVPANVVNPHVCAVVGSALANRYSIPTILGYKGEGFMDAQRAHIAKLRAIRHYLQTCRGDKDDLVIIVDGFDVMAQLPAEAMIERYFSIMAKEDQILADQRGISVEELHASGIRQTLLWGTDKGCFPEGDNDPRCWLVPFSTLPRYKWGPRTNNGELIYSDSRFLNSGTVIGPLGDLSTFIEAALSAIEDNWDQDYFFRDSDQFYISSLYARQEYQRAVDLNGGRFPEEVGDRSLPKNKEGEDDVTEYHVVVDFDSSFTQTQCHNNRFIHKLQFDNYDLTAHIGQDVLEEGNTFRPYKIQMPAVLYQALYRVYESLPPDDRPQMPARNWVQSLKLGTNIGTQKIYAFYHNTCDKAGFVNKYHDSWFFPLIRPLLRSAAKAIREKRPIGPRPIDGRVWMPAREYPTDRNLQDEFGGVFTDMEGEEFIPLQQFCGDDLISAIGTEVEFPLSRLTK